MLEDQRARVFHRGEPASITIDSPAELALLIPGARVLAPSVTGQIVVTDLTTRAATTLAEHASKPRYMKWTSTWAFVQFTDGFIWRRDFAGGVTSTLSLGSGRDGGVVPDLMADGRMWIAEGNSLHQNRNGDEPPGSRPHRRSEFHLRFHPFADPFGGTAVRDESLGRVPHSNLFVAEQIQIIQQFWAEGSTLTRSTRMSAGCLLSFSIRTDRIIRDGKRVNHDIHSLFYRQHL